MKVSAVGRALIERNEGCYLYAYPDIVGVWTIGYGHIEGVYPGQTITQDEADQMLADDLNNVYGPGVEKALGGAPTTQAQFDALVSLAYNVGVGGVAKSIAVMKPHKAGDYQAAADGFLLWNKAGGREVAGLTRRRHEERTLYLTGVDDAAPAPDAPVDPAAEAAMRDPAVLEPEPEAVISPFDRIKAIQVVLGVRPDGDFREQSKAALNDVLRDANQPGL